MKRVLLSWIGTMDRQASQGVEKAGIGPLATAVAGRAHDHVVILSDYDEKDRSAYKAWLAKRTDSPIVVRPYRLASPVDYADIYRAVRDAITWVKKQFGDDAVLSIHTSSGTPAMQVVWVLVGTMEGATLLGSSPQAGVQTLKIPFDIAAEFIPAVVRRADADMQRVASGAAPEDASFADIVGRSDVMRRVLERAKVAAAMSVPVLIEGESGTGKELLARAIHERSGRKGRFVAVNCGAIPKDLVESEFFGHKKGAFTGAHEDRKGHFEQAHDGTLFLDELGELPLPAQVRLLRALQEKRIVRVGESREIPVDVRILSATNRDLAAEVARGAFREDLYFRLAILTLDLPPLRAREGDVALLVERLLERLHGELGISAQRKTLSPGARKLLQRHLWPGNVRELEATLVRALVWSKDKVISEEDMRGAIRAPRERVDATLDPPLGKGFDLEKLLDETGARFIRRALSEAGNNKTKAAALIGFKSHQRLSQWMTRLGLEE